MAIVVAASIRTAFDLDRFLVPKEFVLHLTAVLAGLFVLSQFRRLRLRAFDFLLLAFLGLSIISSLFATNPWVAIRAVAITASGIALFWTARILRSAGHARQVAGAIAVAVVLTAATSLLQTYGVRLDIFSLNRAPGGTLGNRNFVAHVAAFGFPMILFVALGTRRRSSYTMSLAGLAIVTAALVLTRSRAAWLAAAAAAVVFLAFVPLRETWKKLAGVLAIAIAAMIVALLVPNTLRWRADNPYLDTVAGIANYEEGSGRGRLVQYQRSMRLAASHPIFGVGPGNWAVEYPAHVPGSDPSLDRGEAGTTSNPWPSSDWVAHVSERGFIAAIALAAAMALIAASSLRRSVESAALLAMLCAAVVAGMFDAVLLLALPAFLVWVGVGVLWVQTGEEPSAHPKSAAEDSGAPNLSHAPKAILICVLFVCLIGAVRSASQIIAMELYASSPKAAATVDPGNYRAHMRLSRQCGHALAAHALYPNAAAARAAARRCD